MKPLKISYGKKQLVITKDILTIFISVVILIADALLAGILQLFEFGFDMSYLRTSEFWTAYAIKLAISYTALFGAYIMRKVIDKQTPKFAVQREKIKDCKKAIVKGQKIAVCKNWLKYVYNYHKKVEKYQEFITHKYDKLIVNEPEKPNIEHINKNNWFGKLKIKRLDNKYKKQMQKYKQSEMVRKYLEEQLFVCEKHFEIIECYKKHNVEQAKKILEEIKSKDNLKSYRQRHKDVTYNRLFNVDLSKNTEDDSIEYNEASVLLRKIMPAIFGGLIMCSILTSIIVKTGTFTGETILLIALNLLLELWFIFTGIRFADSFVFGTVFSADGNRIMICQEFLEDSQANGDNWQESLNDEVEDADPDLIENEQEPPPVKLVEEDEHQITKLEDEHFPIVRPPHR